MSYFFKNFDGNWSAQAGFSLLELILVMLILGGVMCMAIPGWQAVLNKQRMQQVVQGVRHMIGAARHSALMLHSRVLLCPYQAGSHCGGVWSHGLMVGSVNSAFSQDGASDPSYADLRVIRVWQSLPSGWNLVWRSSLGKNSALVFQSNGELLGQQGSFYVMYPHAKPAAGKQLGYSAKIIVSASGYVH